MLRRITARLGHDTVEPGADTERTMGFGNTIMVWLAANMVVTTLLTGTLFVPGILYLQAILIILLGTLLGVGVLSLVGCIGTRTGLPTMVLTRASFGIRGGTFPALLNLAVLMGWSWVQALLAGIAVNSAVETLTGFSNVPLFTILCQSLVVLLALFGHQGIERVEPFIAAGMIAAIAFDVVVATAISWTVLSADFNRNAKTQLGGISGTVIGYTTSTFLAMSLGATAAAYAQLRGGAAQGFDAALLVENFGIAAAVVVFLSVMATNTLVVYGMIMSFLNLRPQSGFVGPALVIGLVSIIGALWQGILDRFLGFLLLIGTFFVPVFAIMLADYWILRRGSYSVGDVLGRGRDYWYTGGFNLPAWVAYVVGAGLALYWTRISPLSFGATVPVFLITFVLYLALRFSADR